MDINYSDSEQIFEVKGNGDEWKIHYPDEGDIMTPYVWYDKEGKIRTVIYAGGSSGKLTETNETFSSAKEAIAYAKNYLGAENIKLIKTKKKKKKEEIRYE
jgi:hypothetical protein